MALLSRTAECVRGARISRVIVLISFTLDSHFCLRIIHRITSKQNLNSTSKKKNEIKMMPRNAENKCVCEGRSKRWACVRNAKEVCLLQTKRWQYQFHGSLPIQSIIMSVYRARTCLLLALFPLWMKCPRVPESFGWAKQLTSFGVSQSVPQLTHLFFIWGIFLFRFAREKRNDVAEENSLRRYLPICLGAALRADRWMHCTNAHGK